MRRQLLALDHQHGGGLVHSFHRKGKPRKYWVHLERFKAALESDPEAREAELSYIVARLEAVEKRLDALKTSHRELKRRVLGAARTPSS